MLLHNAPRQRISVLERISSHLFCEVQVETLNVS